MWLFHICPVLPFFFFFFTYVLFFLYFIFLKIAKLPAPHFFPFLTPAVEIRDGGEPALGTRAVYKNYFFEILIFLKLGKNENVGPFL